MRINMRKIGYLGPEGTFCQEAYYRLNEETLWGKGVIYPTIHNIIKGVAVGEIEEGIVPIENSIEGSVNLTIDLLIHQYDLKIKREIIIPIRHHLMTKGKKQPESLKIIISHPQAAFQCRRYLEEKIPHARFREASSTAQAAFIVANRQGPIGAIAGERAAIVYNLEIIEKDIQMVENNYTRFIVVAKEDNGIITGNDKTSIVFSVDNKPGCLYRVLQEFAERGLNLTKIESRPSRRTLGEYIFWVDVDGHREERKIKDAIESIKGKSQILKVMGSYPVDLSFK
ncbi:prephenate dehydratase [Koleobacter methoxysyntrophicus]|nr:prephenate dehydratase [Koleobacter methoxysyntrophicus]